MTTITGNDIQAMVGHWLRVPVNGFLGSDYGSDIKALLQAPQSDTAADGFIKKMLIDIPILRSLPDGSINLYGVQTAPDRLDLVIEVAGQTIQIPGA